MFGHVATPTVRSMDLLRCRLPTMAVTMKILSILNEQRVQFWSILGMELPSINGQPRESRPQEGCTGCMISVLLWTKNITSTEDDKSLVLWIPSCCFIWADFNIAVETAFQPFRDHHLSCSGLSLILPDLDYVLVQPDKHQTARFENAIGPFSPPLPTQSTLTKQVWCDADCFDRPWMFENLEKHE